MSEDFSYSTGSLGGNGAWVFNAVGTDLTVTSPGTALTYTGYNVGGGNYVAAPTPTSSRSEEHYIYSSVPSSTNTFYYSALIRVSAADATGTYCFGLSGSSIAATARLFIKQGSVAGTFKAGISKTANANIVYGTTNFNFNQTYLVVVMYTFKGAASGTDESAYLWINPTLPSEPLPASADASITSANGFANAQTGTYNGFLWTNRDATAPTVTFDGVKVAYGSTSANAWGYLNSGTITSVQSGSWSSGSTWSGGNVPTFADNVTIADGHTVTVDVAASCYNLNVGQGTGGVLEFEQSVSRTLAVGGDITIASGATFRSNNSGSVVDHKVNASGNLYNSGTIDFSTNSNSAGAQVVFLGSSSTAFTCYTGSSTNLRSSSGVTLNKGSSSSSVLIFTPAGTFTVQGANSNGFLTITNGEFKLDGSASFSNPLFTSASVSVPSTGALWVNNSNATIVAQAGTWTLSGSLIISNGTVNVGTATDNSIQYNSGAILNISSGALNVAARIAPVTAGANTLAYTQSGGTVTVVKVGSTTSNFAGFDLSNGNSSFTMSGGTLVLQKATSNFVDYYNTASTNTVTGGNIEVGNSSTSGSPVLKMYSTVSFYNLNINSTGTPTARLLGVATVSNNLTIAVGSNFDEGGFAVSLSGNLSNSGTFTPGTGTVTLGGSGTQTISGSSTTTFYGLTLSNTTSAIAVTSNVSASNLLTINSGAILSPSSTTTIGGAGTMTGSGTARVYKTGTANDFTGQYTITNKTLTSLTIEVIGAAAQQLGITTFGKLKINNSNGVTINGDITINTLLTFTAGVITTSSNKVIVPSGGSIATSGGGWVSGNLQKYIGTALTQSFEVGNATIYAPMDVTFTGAPTGTGSLVASTTSGSEPHENTPTTTASGIDQSNKVNRYWTFTNSGVSGYTSYKVKLTFAVADVVGSASPLTYVVRKWEASSNWSATTTGTLTTTSAEGSALTSFGEYEVGAPSILSVTAPISIARCIGQSASFSVTASGYPADYSYQWKLNGVSVGTNSNVYSINSVSNGNAGSYTVTVTNSYGSEVSNAGTLTANPSPDVSSFSLSTNVAVCTGSTAAVKVTSSSLGDGIFTVSYSLSGANTASTTASLTMTSGTGTFATSALSNAGSTTITLTLIRNSNSCPTVLSSPAVSTTVSSYIWTGSTSTNWNVSSNWCSGLIPSSTTDTYIPGDLTNYPVLSSGANGSVNNIMILTGTTSNGSLILSGKILNVAGSINNSGTFNAAAGSIRMNGTSAQAVNGISFYERALAGLIMENSAGVTLSGALSLSDSLVVTSGNFDLAGVHLTLKSSSTNTARIAPLAGTISNATNVTVERFITGQRSGGTERRSYRLLCPSVNTTGSVNANWQEGVHNTVIGTNINPNPAYGTQITGTGGVLNNFDATQTNAASLYTYNNSSPAWLAASNTNDVLNAKTGYLLFVRGDRSVDLTSQVNPLPATSTTLRATGTVLTGNQTYSLSLANDFSLVTNPYPSPIDWTKVYADNGSFQNYYTYWEPTINSRGGFVTVCDDGTKEPAIGNDATTEIQSGQAFFVMATTPNTSLTIREAHKSYNNNVRVFTRNPGTLLRTSLYYYDATGTRLFADGARVRFDSSFSKGLDPYDAEEIANWDENIATLVSGKKLSIQSRPFATGNDTIQLFMSHMKVRGYEFELSLENVPVSKTVELLDKFLGTRTPVNTGAPFVVPFTITSNPLSQATDRFSIIMSPSIVLAFSPINITAVALDSKVSIAWSVSQEWHTQQYEVEHSGNGWSFNPITTMFPNLNNGQAASYKVVDEYPQKGTNYYRIKWVDDNGSSTYSKVARVDERNIAAVVEAYPNPVKGNLVTLKFRNVPHDSYPVSLTDMDGRIVLNTVINYLGEDIQLKLPRNLVPASYVLKIGTSLIRLETAK